MYLGIDIGSVTIKYAVIDSNFEVKEWNYIRTHGEVVKSLKKLLKSIKTKEIKGIATTGSGRRFVGNLIGADIWIDEITAHRAAILRMYPQVHTIFEIGGQDSKLIYFSDKSVNFEMNHVCAAGTGSFLDQQAARLGYSIEKFFKKGLTTEEAHKIASKCTVFAESDMVYAQQSGIPVNKVIRGVHKGMITNYFNQLCRGKQLKGDFLFEGGTSENDLLADELANKLIETKLIQDKKELLIPKPYNKVIGAIGAAITLIKTDVNNPRLVPKIKKFKFLESRECMDCVNKCGAKITTVLVNKKKIIIGRQCQE